MSDREYDAILLDLDGTLVADDGTIDPFTHEKLLAASDAGVIVMIATGRSEGTAKPIVEQLGIDNPAVIYNGAAVYDPQEDRLIEERNLGADLLRRLLDYADRFGHLPVIMCPETKLALTPRTEAEEIALHDMSFLRVVTPEELRAVDRSIRVSLFSATHESPDQFVQELTDEVKMDGAYLTWFPLNLLPAHRESPLLVIDVQPRCNGKAEAFRILESRWQISAERTIAVGDAGNDIPMLEIAGLSVAMGNAVPEVKAMADRVIGRNDTATIGELVSELLL